MTSSASSRQRSCATRRSTPCRRSRSMAVVVGQHGGPARSLPAHSAAAAGGVRRRRRSDGAAPPARRPRAASPRQSTATLPLAAQLAPARGPRRSEQARRRGGAGRERAGEPVVDMSHLTREVSMAPRGAARGATSAACRRPRRPLLVPGLPRRPTAQCGLAGAQLGQELDERDAKSHASSTRCSSSSLVCSSRIATRRCRR